MSKGFSTASAMVLVSAPVSLDEIERELARYQISRRVEAQPTHAWMSGYPAIIVALKAEINAYISVEVIDRPWPDTMGDPKTDADLFGAWATGFFGPFVFPGSLAQAVIVGRSRPGILDAAQQHRGFIRIRASHCMGAGDDAQVLPPDYDPVYELLGITNIAARLMSLPAALCYFNPNGQTILNPADLTELRAHHRKLKLRPLPVWVNVRLFRPPDPEWIVMDTIGMQQLDASDHEAVFRRNTLDPDQVANFLWNAASYAHDQISAITAGNTIDGAGIRWRAMIPTNPASAPLRPVVRWVPMDEKQLPDEMS